MTSETPGRVGEAAENIHKKCQTCPQHDGHGCTLWEDPDSCGDLNLAPPERDFTGRDAFLLLGVLFLVGLGMLVATYVIRAIANGLGLW